MAKDKQTQSDPEIIKAEPVPQIVGAEPDPEVIEVETTVKAGPRYVVTITSPQARRRAGFAFGPTPVHLTEADLDESKIKALKADPLLSIRPYEPEDADKE